MKTEVNEEIPNVSIPEGILNNIRIERKHIKPDPIHSIRAMFNGGRYVPEGTYTFLYRDKTLVMSDTPDEKNDHRRAVEKAKGNCLIAGLGIGMVLNAMAMKPEVEHIDVVEIDKDIIDFVFPYYKELYGDKIIIHNESIFEFKPERKKTYDVAWFDIWDYLCTDNLEEMKILHRKFARKAKWKNSWGKEFLMMQKRKGW